MAMPGQAGLGAGAWLSPGLHQPNSRGRRKEEQGLRGPWGEMGCGLGPSGQGWGHLNRRGPAGPGGTELPLPMASASASGAHSPEQLIRGASALVSPPGPGADAGEGPCPARGVGGLLPGPCLAEGWRPADGGRPHRGQSEGTCRGKPRFILQTSVPPESDREACARARPSAPWALIISRFACQLLV